MSNPIGQVNERQLVTEMEESYLDYAMSVIVQRALPDARDGLKPVHRRILYAMNKLNLRHSGRYRKSATVVGEVIGKYHPHGDTAIYDSLVRLAQDFSMRYPLVDGQGNFGSMDGDSAAAMRYTEARMESIADLVLQDIDKNTVDFVPNFDNSRKEPSVLPSLVPNMLINGSQGIAVGMATNIPPHNLTEVIDATVHLIDNPEATIEDLTKFVLGPDFPTGGTIFDSKEIAQAYATGRGRIVMRAKTQIIEDKKGRFQIIIDELPYQVNKAMLIQKIAELVKSDKLDGIKDIRDESDKDGVRVVIELKKDAYPKKVLNNLFKQTQLQHTFGFNALALVDGGIQPRVLNLRMLLQEHVNHREVVVTRRTQFDLEKARARAHILEGLKKALDHIDEVIATIKKSSTKELAHKNLMKKFGLSELQTTAILDMRLQTLAGLERKKIEDELNEKRILITELEAILADSDKLFGIIKQEMLDMKARFGDERRTRIMKRKADEFTDEDLVANESILVAVTKGGYIKRLSPETYKSQGRGGKGVLGMATKEEDMVQHFFSANALDDILFFTNEGRVFQLKAYELPEASRIAKGQAIVNFLQLSPTERITSVIPLTDRERTKFLAMATNMGIVKKVKIEDFKHVRRSGLIAIRLQEGDALRWVRETAGDDYILLVTRQGKSILFEESDIRAMGRVAAGVRGIKLQKDDSLVGMDSVTPAETKGLKALVITENGYGKKTPLKDYRLQGRGGTGIITAKVTKKNGPLVSMKLLDKDKETGDLLMISKHGQVIRIGAASVPNLGRSTQGVRVMRLKSSDEVASVAMLY
jgi:DNA gyrase subunit A